MSKLTLRTIAVNKLRPGMFVHDLKIPWIKHLFLRSRFLIKDDRTIEKIVGSNISEVVIDITRGADIEVVHDSAVESVIHASVCEKTTSSKLSENRSVEHERLRAKYIKSESIEILKSLILDIQAGKCLDVTKAERVVDKVIESTLRNKDALSSLLQVKNSDPHGFLHSLSVSVLSILASRTLKLPDETIREIGIGALLHDIGKSKIDNNLLQKPGKLDANEINMVRKHVSETDDILKGLDGISSVAYECAVYHHEKLDGSGYPFGLSGPQIPIHSQIVSIADAYDAMTTGRVYQKRIEPTEALRQLYRVAEIHYKRSLLDAFICTIGVYPTGTLVRLDSEHLAVVKEVNQKCILKPLVQVIYDAKRNYPVLPYFIDLARRQDSPKILNCESFEKWRLDPTYWLEI